MVTLLDFYKGQKPDLLTIKVTPKASSNRIKIETQSDGNLLIRAYLTTAPEDGKANAALIKMMSKELGLPLGAFEIIKGIKSRNKVLKILK